jgi:hypothetical protein
VAVHWETFDIMDIHAKDAFALGHFSAAYYQVGGLSK